MLDIAVYISAAVAMFSFGFVSGAAWCASRNYQPRDEHGRFRKRG